MTAKDSVHEALSGRPAISYTSPPQPYEQALALAVALLGHRPPAANSHPARGWERVTAIAGGRRRVTLAPHDLDQTIEQRRPIASDAAVDDPVAVARSAR